MTAKVNSGRITSGTNAPSGANAANSDAAAGAGLRLALHEIATGLTDPTDLAVVPDGRIFVYLDVFEQESDTVQDNDQYRESDTVQEGGQDRYTRSLED